MRRYPLKQVREEYLKEKKKIGVSEAIMIFKEDRADI